MRRAVLALLILAFVVAVPAALFAQNGDLTAERRAELQKQLSDLERQMAQTQNSIDALYSEGESLKRDIAILDGQIKKAQLQVRTTELEIQSLSEGIILHTRTIGDLTTKLAEDQKSLAQVIRRTAEADEYTFVEAMFSTSNISDFLGDLDTLASINEAMQLSFEEVRTTRTRTTEERSGLETQRTDQQILRTALILDKQEVEKKEDEKQALLAETKGQENLYRQLKSVQERTAAEIRAQLFPLRDAGGIQFGSAVDYAKQASAKTGVRPAMILAILSQESDLGKNVGQCLVTDLTTGDGKGKNTGTPFPGTMKAPRDTVPFERITKALGRDWASTVISCPQPGGYGGAMGPTQFIPSTWESYEARLKSALGVANPDPWNGGHAIMATGLYLADVGAAGGSYTGEHTAAARYYAGGNWATSGQGYANSVMAKAAAFQTDIDFLEQN